MATQDQTHKEHLGHEGEEHNAHPSAPHSTPAQTLNSTEDNNNNNNGDIPQQSEMEGPPPPAGRCNIDWMAYNLDPRKAFLVPILGAVIFLLVLNLAVHVHPFVNAVLFIVMFYVMLVVGNMLQVYWLAVHYEAFRTGELDDGTLADY